MTDILGAVVSVAQVCNAVYQVVDGIKSYDDNLVRVAEELHDFSDVLAYLLRQIDARRDGYEHLRDPLSRCRKTCADFKDVIDSHVKNASKLRIDTLKWIKYQFIQSKIAAFSDRLAKYKATITIALAAANLGTAMVDRQVLDQLQAMIRETTDKLTNQGEEIKFQLREMATATSTGHKIYSDEGLRLQRQHDGIERSLEMCAKVHDCINSVRFSPTQPPSASSSADSSSTGLSPENLSSAEFRTLTVLSEFGEKLTEVMDEIKSKKHTMSAPSQLEEELEDTEQCLSIMSDASARAAEAEMNVIRNVKVGKDGLLLHVTTLNQLIYMSDVEVETGGVHISMINGTNENIQDMFKLLRER
ncbi:hypothetical protein BX600DRAFT_119245 [Xylariales sp. PMI_506]|nr:hypothetical protein BX600DRAFT_119245 [Xylariales sp. PMI_506]